MFQIIHNSFHVPFNFFKKNSFFIRKNLGTTRTPPAIEIALEDEPEDEPQNELETTTLKRNYRKRGKKMLQLNIHHCYF